MESRYKATEWRLDDAEARAQANPYTFWKPSSELVARLQSGHLVKLIFLLNDPQPEDPSAERMWVEIDERTEDAFVGRLESQPVYIPGLHSGDRIEFTDRHIIDACIDDPVPDQTLPWTLLCFVTNRILEDGKEVGHLYREAPDREADSGWRFTCGDEAQEYMDDIENVQLVTLGAVLACDDRILPLLDRQAPVAFEWSADMQEFVECAPFTENWIDR